METIPAAGFVNVSLGRIRLKKGQVHDLGRVEFNSGIEIVVSVVDVSGQPLEGARVSCMDEEMWVCFSSGTTDEYGVAVVKSPFNTAGYIQVQVDDPATGLHISGTISFQVGGEQDRGKEFMVPLTEVVAGL